MMKIIKYSAMMKWKNQVTRGIKGDESSGIIKISVD